MFLTLAGVTLHFRRDGPETGRPVVFVNALGSDLRIWDDVVDQLGGDVPVLRYDKRGHGLWDAPRGPYRLQDHTTDLALLLDQLGLPPVAIVGVSVGGMIALDLAARHSERVALLVLSSTAARIGTRGSWNERIDSVRREGLERLATSLIERWFAPGFIESDPDACRGYGNMLRRTPELGYVATCAAIRDADLAASVPRVAMPSLVLCGSEDVSTPPAQARDLAGKLPRARFALVEGAGHLPCIEKPVAVARLLRAFLDENGYF